MPQAFPLVVVWISQAGLRSDRYRASVAQRADSLCDRTFM